MMDGGWIKIHRKMLDSSIFANEKLLKVWIWCLCKANWEDKKTMIGLKEIEMKRGQFICGKTKASGELRIPPSTFNRLLHKLEELQMVRLEVGHKWTLVTIENYTKYQDDDSEVGHKWDANGTQVGHKWDASETQVRPTKNNKNNKKEKKVKKDKNNICASADADALFERLWQLYPKKRGKAKVSDKQKQKLLDIGYDNMAKAIHRYVDECRETKYMKLGSTFFNSGYVDFLDENYEALPIDTHLSESAERIYNVQRMAEEWAYEDDETGVHEDSFCDTELLP